MASRAYAWRCLVMVLYQRSLRPFTKNPNSSKAYLNKWHIHVGYCRLYSIGHLAELVNMVRWRFCVGLRWLSLLYVKLSQICHGHFVLVSPRDPRSWYFIVLIFDGKFASSYLGAFWYLDGSRDDCLFWSMVVK